MSRRTLHVQTYMKRAQRIPTLRRTMFQSHQVLSHVGIEPITL